MATQAATRNISGLARALAQSGLMSEYEAETLQTQAQGAGVSFVEQVLVGKRMTAQQLAVFASRAFGTPLLDLAAFDTDQIQKDLIDVKMAQTRRVLPLYKRSNKLYVAISDPANLQALEEVRFKTNLVPEPIVVEDDKLGMAIARIVDQSGANLKEMAKLDDLEIGLEDGNPPNSASIEDEADVEDAPVVKYIQKLLTDAINAGASDIHFEPYERYFRVRYRIDGVLIEITQPPLAIKDKVSSRIKVISKLDISEKRVPQDGRMKLVLNKTKSIDFRVSTLPTLYGEKIVMRILDSSGVKLGIEALGYEPDQQEALMHAIKRPYGMILVTGPTGSGKTTTLYSILNHINAEGIHIMTLEDPVEYPMALVRQTSVAESSKLDFANGIRSMMRQDPDVILVGEVRDADTAEMAFRAAMTGHQVYTTLHTNSAIGAIPRLLDIGVLPDIMAGNIIGIVAQRLVRRLCEHCKSPYVAEPHEAHLLDVPPEVPRPVLCRPTGCEHCDFQGYRGRIAIMELLRIDSQLDELIARRATAHEIRARAIQKGFRTLADDGLRRVRDGSTSLDELARVVDLTDRM